MVVCGVGGYESSVAEVVVDIEYGGVVVQWVWEVVIIACLQMELPMLIDVVIYVVYCVTLLLGGGCAVRIACCNV